MEQKGVVVENAPGREREYIIKDNAGITVGRFYTVEVREEHRHYTLRLSFYRQNNYNLLKDALNIMLKKIFNSTTTYKVNLLVDENHNIRAIADLGFVLEGVVEESIIDKSEFRTELLFGINVISFQTNNRLNVLRLRGNNIELKVLTPDDSEQVLQYNIKNKEHLKYYEPAREESFYTLEVQRRILIESYKQYLNGSSISFGIFKGEELIGKIQLSNIVMGIFRNGFIGYSIDKDEQGKGYMKEALKLVTNYAFKDMELHRIEGSALVDNERSQRVLLDCGFKELGVNKNYLFINGAWRDHKTFYLINN